MRRSFLLAAAAVSLAGGALANDTMATLGTGGLVFVRTDAVKMVSEDLYISPDEVRVTYEFRNESDEDATSLVAFPMPDITGSPELMTAIPTEDPENIFGFETRVAGNPVDATLHQYAFAHNIEYSEVLREKGIPLAPHSQQAIDAVEALNEADQLELFALGLVVPMEFDAGQGWEKHYYPAWTLNRPIAGRRRFQRGRL